MPAVLVLLAAGLVLLAPAPPAALAASRGATSISTGGDFSSCTIEGGKAYCWGSNYFGQLGDGSTTDSSVPVAVDTSGVLAGKTLTQIATGYAGNCALDSTGAAYCWGGNGELGDGHTTDSSVPVAVDTSGVLAGKALTQIVAGGASMCALDSTGAAYCWGNNAVGELGDGSNANSSVPVAVDVSGVLAGKTLTRIAAGGATCALDSAGAAYCWGDNDFGELGDGSTANSDVPVAVDASGALAGKTLTRISAGIDSMCALSGAGAAYCWGDNGNGELGDGSTTSSDVPVAVDASGALAGKALTQIGAGWGFACALSSTGAAYCWGNNGSGELGDGSAIASSVPVAVETSGALAGKTLTQVTAGVVSCALDSKGAAYCWGFNGDGELGVGSTSAQSDVPVLVGPRPIVSGYRNTKCVDDPGNLSVNDTKIVMRDCNGAPEESWIIEADGTIQHDGKCMDIYRDEKVNKAPVELWTCTGGANQQWQPRNGTLVNPVSRKCLDDPRFSTANGTQLEIYTCNGGANQQWKLPLGLYGNPGA